MGDERSRMIRPWVVNVLLLVAAGAWLADFAMGILRPDYVINESVDSIFLAVITGIVAARLHSDSKDEEGGPDDHDDPSHGGTA